MSKQRWALIESESDGTEDFRLFTSVGDLALTLYGDMAFVGLWRGAWRERGTEILEERALDADELARLLQRAGVASTEAAEIASSLWPSSARGRLFVAQEAKRAARRAFFHRLLRRDHGR
jgi:hypothetical protein